MLLQEQDSNADYPSLDTDTILAPPYPSIPYKGRCIRVLAYPSEDIFRVFPLRNRAPGVEIRLAGKPYVRFARVRGK